MSPLGIGDVRFQGQSRSHLLASSISGFDPFRTCRLVSPGSVAEGRPEVSVLPEIGWLPGEKPASVSARGMVTAVRPAAEAGIGDAYERQHVIGHDPVAVPLGQVLIVKLAPLGISWYERTRTCNLAVAG